jgi:hypothetical protein
MLASGLLAALVGALSGVRAAPMALASLMAGALVPAVYSLVLARRTDR